MLQIEGPALKPKEEVILLDDVATSGGSLVEAIDILKKLDVVVRQAIVIIDREEGAKESLSLKRCPLISIFKASDFFSSKLR